MKIAVGVVIGVALLAAAALAVFVLLDANSDDSQAGSSGPAGTGAPPTDVRLRDAGSSVTVSWTDPAAGQVPFVVSGGQVEEQLRPMSTVPAGDTTFTVHALNPRVDYCFAVVAVYSATDKATSSPACTARNGSPTPS